MGDKISLFIRRKTSLMSFFKRIPKWMVWVVLSLFVFSDVGHSAIGALSPEVQISELDTATLFRPSISKDLGKVDWIKTSASGGPAIFHLQTVHGNYEAQKNIEEILQELYEKYGVRDVLVEGTSGLLHPDILRLLPQDLIQNQNIVDQLMRDGLVKGADSFLIQNTKTQGFGIENLSKYVENREALKKLKLSALQNQSQIAILETHLESLKAKNFKEKDLRSFIDDHARYKQASLPFGTWLETLKKIAKERLLINLSDPAFQFDWPMLTRYFTLQEIEAKLDLSIYVAEKNKFFEAIRPFLRSQRRVKAFQSLLNENESEMTGSYREQEALLESLIRSLPKTFNFETYPQLKLFLAYRLIKNELNMEDLILEINDLRTEVLESFTLSEVQQKVLYFLESWSYYRLLFSQSLSKDDFREVKKIHSFDVWLRELGSFLPDLKLRSLEDLYKDGIKFYEGAEKRDLPMLENLEQFLQEHKIEKVVVVTGGFHADAFKEYFDSKNFSYALISPQMTQFNDQKDEEIYSRNLFQNSNPKIQKSTLETSSPLLLPRDIRAHGSDPSYEQGLVLRRAFEFLGHESARVLNQSEHAKAFGYQVDETSSFESMMASLTKRSELRADLNAEEIIYPDAGLKGLPAQTAKALVMQIPDDVNIEVRVWNERTSRSFSTAEKQRFETGMGLTTPADFDLSYQDVQEVRTTIYDRSTGAINVKVAVEAKDGRVDYINLDGFDTSAMQKLKNLMPPISSMVDSDTLLQVSAGNQGDLKGNFTLVSEADKTWKLFAAVDENWAGKKYPAFVQMKDGRRLLGKLQLTGDLATNTVTKVLLTTAKDDAVVALTPEETHSILVAYVLGWGEESNKDLLEAQYDKTSDLRHIFGFPRYEGEKPSMLFYDQLLQSDEQLARAYRQESVLFDLKDNYGNLVSAADISPALKKYGYVQKNNQSEVKLPGDYYLENDSQIHLVFQPAVYPLNSLVVSRDGTQSAFVAIQGMSGNLGANYWQVFDWVKKQLPWAYALFALDNGMDPSWRKYEDGQPKENLIEGRDRVNASLTLQKRSELLADEPSIAEKPIPQLHGVVREKLIPKDSDLFWEIRKLQKFVMDEMPGVFNRVENPHITLASRIARRLQPVTDNEVKLAVEKDRQLYQELPEGVVARPKEFRVSLTGGLKINLSVEREEELNQWRIAVGDSKERINHYTLLRPKVPLSAEQKNRVMELLARYDLKKNIPGLPIDSSELLHYEDVAYAKIHLLSLPQKDATTSYREAIWNRVKKLRYQTEENDTVYAYAVIEEFRETMRPYLQQKAFDLRWFSKMTDNVSFSSSAHFKTNNNQSFAVIELPVSDKSSDESSGYKDERFLVFRIAGKIVAYGIAHLDTDNEVIYDFHLLEPYREELKKMKAALYETGLAVLFKRYQTDAFVFYGNTQIESKVGNSFLSTMFYLKRGFFPESYKADADKILKRILKGEVIQEAEVTDFVEKASSSRWISTLTEPKPLTLLSKLKFFLKEGAVIMAHGAFTYALNHPAVPKFVILVKRNSAVLATEGQQMIRGPQISEAEERAVYKRLREKNMAPKTIYVGYMNMLEIKPEWQGDVKREEIFRDDQKALAKLMESDQEGAHDVEVSLQEEGLTLDHYRKEHPDKKDLVARSLAEFTRNLWRMGLIDLDIAWRNYLIPLSDENKFPLISDGFLQLRIHDFGALMPLPEDIYSFFTEKHAASDVSRGFSFLRNLVNAVRTSQILFPKLNLYKINDVAQAAYAASQKARLTTSNSAKIKQAYLDVLSEEANQKLIAESLRYVAEEISKVRSELRFLENNIQRGIAAISVAVTSGLLFFKQALNENLFYVLITPPLFAVGYLMVKSLGTFMIHWRIQSALAKGSKYWARGSYTHVLKHSSFSKDVILVKRNPILMMQRKDEVISSPQITEDQEKAVYRALRKHSIVPKTRYVGQFPMDKMHPEWSGVEGEDVFRLDQKKLHQLSQGLSQKRTWVSVYLQEEKMPLNQYVKNHPEQKNLADQSLAQFTNKLWDLGWIDLDLGRRNYLLVTDSEGNPIKDKRGLFQLEVHDFGAIMRMPEDLKTFLNSKHFNSDITRGFFFLRNLTATVRTAKILFPNLDLKKFHEISKAADEASDLAKKSGTKGAFKEAYLRVINLPEHKRFIEKLAAQIAIEIKKARSETRLEIQKIESDKLNRSELRSFNDSPDTRYWVGRSLTSLYPGQIVWQPTKSNFKDDPWDKPVKALAHENDAARQLIEEAYEYLYQRASQDDNKNVIRRLQAMSRYTTIVATDIPTYFYFSNSAENFADPTRISFSQRTIFFSKKLLDEWGRGIQSLSLREQQLRIRMMALYLNRSLHILETFYRMEEAGSSVKEIHDKILNLIQEDDFKNKEWILRELKEKEITSLIFPLADDDAGTNLLRHAELLDSKIPLLDAADKLEKLLENAVGEGRSIYDDPKLNRENFLKIAKQLEVLALHIDSTGDHKGATQLYRRALSMYHRLQQVDPKAFGPYQIQSQVVAFLLRAGLLDDFLTELKKILSGKGFPSPADQRDSDAIGLYGNKAGESLVPDWLLHNGPKLLYALQVYTSILKDPEREAAAERNLAEAERMMMTYWNDFAATDSLSHQTNFDMDLNRYLINQSAGYLPIVGTISQVSTRWTKEHMDDGATHFKVEFLYTEGRRPREVRLGTLKFFVKEGRAVIKDYDTDVTLKYLSQKRFTNLKRSLVAAAVRLAKSANAESFHVYRIGDDRLNRPKSLKDLGFVDAEAGHWHLSDLKQKSKTQLSLRIDSKSRSELRSSKESFGVEDYRKIFYASARDETLAKILNDFGFSEEVIVSDQGLMEFDLSSQGRDFLETVFRGRVNGQTPVFKQRAFVMTQTLEQMRGRSPFFNKSTEWFNFELPEANDPRQIPIAIFFEREDKAGYFIFSLMDLFLSDVVTGEAYAGVTKEFERIIEDVLSSFGDVNAEIFEFRFKVYFLAEAREGRFVEWRSFKTRTPILFEEDERPMETLSLEMAGTRTDVFFAPTDQFSVDFQNFLHRMNSSHTHLFKGKKVLEIGVGSGVNLHHLAKFGASDVRSSDLYSPYVLFSNWNRSLALQSGSFFSEVVHESYKYDGLDETQNADVVVMNTPAIVGDDQISENIVRRSRGIPKSLFLPLFDSFKNYLFAEPDRYVLMRLQASLDSRLTDLSTLEALSEAGNNPTLATDIMIANFLGKHPEIEVVDQYKDLYLLGAKRSELRSSFPNADLGPFAMTDADFERLFGDVRFKETFMKILNDLGQFGNYDQADQKDYLAFKLSARGRYFFESLFQQQNPNEKISFTSQARLLTVTLDELQKHFSLTKIEKEKFNLLQMNEKGQYRIPLGILVSYGKSQKKAYLDLPQLFYSDKLKSMDFSFLDMSLKNAHERILERIGLERSNVDEIELRRFYERLDEKGKFTGWEYFLSHGIDFSMKEGLQTLSVGNRRPYGDVIFEPHDVYSVDVQSFLNERNLSNPDLFKGKRVLEIGSGTGVNLHHFKRFGARVVTLDDIFAVYAMITDWNRVFSKELNPSEVDQEISVLVQSGIPSETDADVLVINTPQVASAARMQSKPAGIVTNSRGISKQDFLKLFNEISNYMLSHPHVDVLMRLSAETDSGLVATSILPEAVIKKMDEYAAMELIIQKFLEQYSHIEMVYKKDDLYHLRTKRSELRLAESDDYLLRRLAQLRLNILPLSWISKYGHDALVQWLEAFIKAPVYSRKLGIKSKEESRILNRSPESRLSQGSEFEKWITEKEFGAVVLDPEWSRKIINEPEVLFSLFRDLQSRADSVSEDAAKPKLILLSDDITEESIRRALKRKSSLTWDERQWLDAQVISRLSQWIKIVRPQVFKRDQEIWMGHYDYAMVYLRMDAHDESLWGKYPAQFLWDSKRLHADDSEWITYALLGLMKTAVLLKDVSDPSAQIKLLEEKVPQFFPGATRRGKIFSLQLQKFAELLLQQQIIDTSA